MHSSPLLAALLAASLAAPAFAQPAAPAGDKTVQVTKVFRYLDNYLEVPEAKRSRIRVSYILLKDGKPAPNLHPALIDGDRRIPLPLSPSGQFLRLPTLDQLNRKLMMTVDAPSDSKLGLDLNLESTVPPAQEVDAQAVRESIAQVSGVLKSAIGALSILAPQFTKAAFIKAGSGVAITASGREIPLPLTKRGAPVYEPGALKDVVKLRFSAKPTRIVILPSNQEG